jgi:predicted cation transporter
MTTIILFALSSMIAIVTTFVIMKEIAASIRLSKYNKERERQAARRVVIQRLLDTMR